MGNASIMCLRIADVFKLHLLLETPAFADAVIRQKLPIHTRVMQQLLVDITHLLPEYPVIIYLLVTNEFTV